MNIIIKIRVGFWYLLQYNFTIFDEFLTQQYSQVTTPNVTSILT